MTDTLALKLFVISAIAHFTISVLANIFKPKRESLLDWTMAAVAFTTLLGMPIFLVWAIILL